VVTDKSSNARVPVGCAISKENVSVPLKACEARS